MSAVAKEEILKIWHVEPAPGEPIFFDESGLDMGVWPGPHVHTEHDLRCLWSLVWKRFGSRRMCGEIIRYNRMFSVDWWREAIEEAWITKPQINNLKYIVMMANSFEREGTPSQRLQKKLDEAARAASPAMESVPVNEDVARFWDQKAKPVTIDSMPEDHPVFIRMMDKIKGSRK